MNRGLILTSWLLFAGCSLETGTTALEADTEGQAPAAEASSVDEPALEPTSPAAAGRTKGEDLEKCLANCPREPGKVEGCRRNCMCRTGHRPLSDCDLIDLLK